MSELQFTPEQIECAAQALYASVTQNPSVGMVRWEYAEWDTRERYRKHAAAVLATVNVEALHA